jgi:hypothetical protein
MECDGKSAASTPAQVERQSCVVKIRCRQVGRARRRHAMIDGEKDARFDYGDNKIG